MAVSLPRTHDCVQGRMKESACDDDFERLVGIFQEVLEADLGHRQ